MSKVLGRPELHANGDRRDDLQVDESFTNENFQRMSVVVVPEAVFGTFASGSNYNQYRLPREIHEVLGRIPD